MKISVVFAFVTFLGLAAHAGDNSMGTIRAMQEAGLRDYQCRFDIPVQRGVEFTRIQAYPVVAGSEREALTICFNRIGATVMHEGGSAKVMTTQLDWSAGLPIEVSRVLVFPAHEAP